MITLSHNLTYTTLKAYKAMVEALPGEYVYDRSVSAVGYMSQNVTFTITDTIGSGPWHVYHNGSRVVTTSNTTFLYPLAKGMNEFYVASTSDTSNTVRMYAYVIHIFLALYALEFLRTKQARIQAIQAGYVQHDSYVEDEYSYDNTFKQLNDLMGTSLGTTCPSIEDIQGYPDFLASVFDAFGVPAMEGFRIIARAFTNEWPIVVQERDMPGMRVGSQRFHTDTPTKVEWDADTIYFDSRHHQLASGEEHLDSGDDVFLYVDGRGSGGYVTMYNGEELPYGSEVSETEVFISSRIRTDDDDGTFTGYGGSKYILLSNYPSSLVSVASTGTVGIEDAWLSGQYLVLGTTLEDSQIGTISVTYKRIRDCRYLARVSRIDDTTIQIHSGRINRGCRIRSNRMKKKAMRVIVRGGDNLTVMDKENIWTLFHRLKPADVLGRLYF